MDDGGYTNNPTRVPSGDTRRDFPRYPALKTPAKQLNVAKHLSIESRGFSMRNTPGWKSQRSVRERP